MVAELANGLLQLVQVAGAKGVASRQEGDVAVLGESGQREREAKRQGGEAGVKLHARLL